MPVIYWPRAVICGTAGSGFDSDSDFGSAADSAAGFDFCSGYSWMFPPKIGCGSPQG